MAEAADTLRAVCFSGQSLQESGPSVSRVFNRQLLIGPLPSTGGANKGKTPHVCTGCSGETRGKAISIRPGSREVYVGEVVPRIQHVRARS